MSISPILSGWLAPSARSLVSALLPQDCFLCGNSAGKSLLCHACAADLPDLTPECCPVCALPTPGAQVCGACLKQQPYFDATRAPLRYAFPVDQLIHSLKYGHQLAIATFLAERMQGVCPDPARVDMLMALPLSPQRLRSRGFNQSVEIARILSKRLCVPLAVTGYGRSIDTVPQSSLPWKERRRNIREAFECALDLRGKRIAVIDDIMTTGATLNEFARTLKNHGAIHVTNWVVARTLKN